MGAQSFVVHGSGESATQAFGAAVTDAAYWFGHGGYTGSIADKGEFVMVPLPEGEDPEKYAEKLNHSEDSPVDDKWGPAGCFKLRDGEYLFFGWAPL